MDVELMEKRAKCSFDFMEIDSDKFRKKKEKKCGVLGKLDDLCWFHCSERSKTKKLIYLLLHCDYFIM